MKLVNSDSTMSDQSVTNDYSQELQEFVLKQKKKAYTKVSMTKARMVKKVPLYYRISDTEWEIYKQPEISISEMRVDQNRLPELYILTRDKAEAAQEAQAIVNQHIQAKLKEGDVESVREGLVVIADELLDEPRSGTYKEAEKSVILVMRAFSRKQDILGQIISISCKDYTTALHSVNVMALMLGFCNFVGYNWQKTIQFSMAALLHDVGKTLIPKKILAAPRKLTNEEFNAIKRHPCLGAQILMNNGITDQRVVQAATEHHEKVNGTGYPKSIKDVSLVGQLVGIIDIYEALTNNDRPYRRAMPPKDALRILVEESNKGAFVYGLVDRFIESLCDPRM